MGKENEPEKTQRSLARKMLRNTGIAGKETPRTHARRATKTSLDGRLNSDKVSIHPLTLTRNERTTIFLFFRVDYVAQSLNPANLISLAGLLRKNRNDANTEKVTNDRR